MGFQVKWVLCWIWESLHQNVSPGKRTIFMVIKRTVLGFIENWWQMWCIVCIASVRQGRGSKSNLKITSKYCLNVTLFTFNQNVYAFFWTSMRQTIQVSKQFWKVSVVVGCREAIATFLLTQHFLDSKAEWQTWMQSQIVQITTGPICFLFWSEFGLSSTPFITRQKQTKNFLNVNVFVRVWPSCCTRPPEKKEWSTLRKWRKFCSPAKRWGLSDMASVHSSFCLRCTDFKLCFREPVCARTARMGFASLSTSPISTTTSRKSKRATWWVFLILWTQRKYHN